MLDAAAVTIRQQGSNASTGHQVWDGASILASILCSEHDSTGEGTECAPAMRKTAFVLELGAGTGKMAIELVRRGWRSIIATDGEKSIVRNMKYNVQANRMGHAIRCCSWNWDEEPPKDLDLAAVDLCIGSDLVYYQRPHANLAAVLRRVLLARNCLQEAPARVLLLVTQRSAEDIGGRVVHRPSAEGYQGSSFQRFLENELPEQQLISRRLTIPSAVFLSTLLSQSTLEAFESAETREAMVLLEVSLSQAQHEKDAVTLSNGSLHRLPV